MTLLKVFVTFYQTRLRAGFTLRSQYVQQVWIGALTVGASTVFIFLLRRHFVYSWLAHTSRRCLHRGHPIEHLGPRDSSPFFAFDGSTIGFITWYAPALLSVEFWICIASLINNLTKHAEQLHTTLAAAFHLLRVPHVFLRTLDFGTIVESKPNTVIIRIVLILNDVLEAYCIFNLLTGIIFSSHMTHLSFSLTLSQILLETFRKR
ncbi:unnamed protein product [Somion occarium]|uniref:Uncharacterized protein n=1 Tax=Somion occarium TaxID=3059160 RepID=A0ABP1CUW7_9APHY